MIIREQALIERENGREVHFYVYNAITDTCRDVTVIPNDQWGGEGCLGCGIGYGYLHRIPSREDRELLIKKSTDDGQTVVNMTAVPAATPPAPVAAPPVPAVPQTPVAAAANSTTVPADVSVMASPSVDAFADVNTGATTSTATDLPSPPMPVAAQT